MYFQGGSIFHLFFFSVSLDFIVLLRYRLECCHGNEVSTGV